MVKISKTKADVVIEVMSIFLIFLGSKSLCFYQLSCNFVCAFSQSQFTQKVSTLGEYRDIRYICKHKQHHIF